MGDVSQRIFDEAETIADAIHEQEGLAKALIGYLDDKLAPEHEHVVFALIEGQRHARAAVRAAARTVAMCASDMARGRAEQ